MRPIFIQVPRRSAPEVIDITPRSPWQRVGAVLRKVLVLGVVLPLFWFVGTLGLLALLGIGAASLTYLLARAAWRGRKGRSAVATAHHSPTRDNNGH